MKLSRIIKSVGANLAGGGASEQIASANTKADSVTYFDDLRIQTQ